jgi:hypothetical protein
MLPAKHLHSSDGIVAFDPLEIIRVTAMGDDVPAFTTDIPMPVQVTTASFDSGPVPIVGASMDAAPPTPIDHAMPEVR